MKIEVAGLEARLLSPEQLTAWAAAAGAMARDNFSFQEVHARVGAPEKTVEVPLEGTSAKEGTTLEINLQEVEFEGNSTTRHAAAFLSSLKELTPQATLLLERMEIEAQPDQPLPIRMRLKWLVAVAPEGKSPPAAVPEAPEKPKKGSKPFASLNWGWREEPFLSPLLNPRSVKVPTAIGQRFKLSGILWDPETPTCVINGAVLKPGDAIEGYKVVLIAENAVMLEKASREEIFLPLK